ncbi:MAG TPA: glycerol-3-phosphate dehydrogenase/oxidase [Terriglobales bacterium]|nr:glycerol-3-phosphate dehydrogenase/oxidase [Terriglobales bacterium]
MSLDTQPRPPLHGQRFDVAVIGGGINGVAIARECARNGRSTLLVEQHDFAAGTTSRSTRLIHGGLRYLEHGEIGLVRESVRERRRLLEQESHLVRPLNFLLALGPQAQRSALEVRFGLWLYRRFAAARPRNRGAAGAIADLERLLDSGERWRIFNYEDAQCEFPERLVAEWLTEATHAGVEARNHTQVLEIEVSNGQARGLRLRDQLTGRESRVQAGWIFNASGPWADRVARMAGLTSSRMIGGVRGAHLVLPKFHGMPDAAIYVEALDGRPIFVIPWNDQVLLGTTEVPDRGDPASVQPSGEEIEYLLESLRRRFPSANLAAEQIRYAYAGVRPLPFVEDESLAAITRRHLLHDHAEDGVNQMISVIGGKLTTAASLARECARKIGLQVEEPRATALIADGGSFEALTQQWVANTAAQGAISAEAARAIAAWHGPSRSAVVQLAASDARLRQPICDNTCHIVAEAVNALTSEHAMTLSDVLLRRVPVALDGFWSEECSAPAAQRIGLAVGWSEMRIGAERETFEAERAAFLQKPVVTAAPARR